MDEQQQLENLTYQALAKNKASEKEKTNITLACSMAINKFKGVKNEERLKWVLSNLGNINTMPL